MKLQHVRIENFKGIRELEFSLLREDESAAPLTGLLGDNGSGKTTVMQAIALTLSLATRRTPDIGRFQWHGFLPERVGSLGVTRVELTVRFDPEEVRRVGELFRDWYDHQSSDWRQSRRIVEPTQFEEVVLVLEQGNIGSPQGFGAVCQFLGRYYVKALLKSQPHRRNAFADLGDVFWFDQFRNLGTAAAGGEAAYESNERTWEAGVGQLREYLLGWWAYNTSQVQGPSGKNYVKDLETQFARLFPGTIFRGTMPREGVAAPSAKDFYFLLERDGRIFDLAEMASGEQAVFCLLYEFVRLGISRSIVLIDELELHLHPPAQQALLAALPQLGTDCQFLITTHSEFLTTAIPENRTVRLPGGTPCL